MIDSSRTHLDILRDALCSIQEHDPLQHHYVLGCRMDDKYCKCCDRDISDNNLREEHRDDCQYYTLIEELEAWIRVEEEIENARG